MSVRQSPTTASHPSYTYQPPVTSARLSPSPAQSHRWVPSRIMPKGHSRSNSISDVLREGRKRAQSITAHEVVDTLKAPISWKLIALCLIWYLSSALSNTSSKSILNAFPWPITVTILQFAFVAGWCLVLAGLARFVPVLGRAIPGLSGGLREPTKFVLMTTIPLSCFQVGGHICSSIATGKIAVSLVHTIKGLSPLFTVAAYRTLFGIHYSLATYLSLVPLTTGVMLACSAEFRGHFTGVVMAFVSTMIFVSQNIFAKKLFNESAHADPLTPVHNRKLDKLNLLFYSSGQAFLLTLPLWMYYEGGVLIREFLATGSIALVSEIKKGKVPLSGWGLVGEIVFNGTVHFGQNIIAFVLLSLVSPVTYSVASLVKRIFVIVMAMAWFRNPTSNTQAAGVALTFLGLYLYDRAGDASRAEKRARLDKSHAEPLLPLNTKDLGGHHNIYESPLDKVDEKREELMGQAGPSGIHVRGGGPSGIHVR